MAPYTLYYWHCCNKFYGRALPIICSLDRAKQEYKIKEKDDEEGAAAGTDDCFAVPFVTFPNGVTISQLAAILEVIGEDHGLAGSTTEEKMKAKQYLGDLTDILSEVFSGKLEGEERADKWFALLESRLSTGHFIGSSISVVDFYAHFVFLFVGQKGISWDKYEKLTKFTEMMANTEEVKKYAESEAALIPNLFS